MSPTYTMGPDAYYKIFFHAAKHPHRSINGVLLGTHNSGTAVEIIDAVPLLHHWTSLSPMMEIGLDLALQYAESVGMKVVGYYQACERLDDTALAPVGEKVASKIKAQFEDTIAFVIDGDKLATTEAALIPYSIASTLSWRPVQSGPPAFTPGSAFQLTSSDLPIQAVKLVQEQNLHFAFGDFDDHLEDVTIGETSSKRSLVATKSLTALTRLAEKQSMSSLMTWLMHVGCNLTSQVYIGTEFTRTLERIWLYYQPFSKTRFG